MEENKIEIEETVDNSELAVYTNEDEMSIISELTNGIQYFSTFNEELENNDINAIEKLMKAMLQMLK